MIPKIIHQLWIGDRIPPIILMNTWKDKHSDFEYILWNEEEFIKRKMIFRCMKQIDEIDEINGKADIMRWEILYKYGGVFIDADTICIEPLDDYFMTRNAFALFENENTRDSLIATTYMGFIPQHPLCRDIINWIDSDESSHFINKIFAWGSVGPVLLSRFLNTGFYKDFSVFPSHCLLPTHFTGLKYEGHKKVYGYHEWGTAKKNNDIMHTITLPDEFKDPTEWVSVLISSYNTPQLYIRECLNSIKSQNGYFCIEVVWINDGSDQENTQILEIELANFQKNTRFCKVIYDKTDVNYGTHYSLHNGILKCNNQIIFKMDSDDIMLPERIRKQLQFMKDTPDCVVCGTNLQMFENENKNTILGETRHPFCITLDDFLEKQYDWFMNHQTLCYRKDAILSVGNYNKDKIYNSLMEDYDLELRLLKKYKKVYTIQEVLLYYRIHPKQITYKMHRYDPVLVSLRNDVIVKVIGEYFNPL